MIFSLCWLLAAALGLWSLIGISFMYLLTINADDYRNAVFSDDIVDLIVTTLWWPVTAAIIIIFRLLDLVSNWSN